MFDKFAITCISTFSKAKAKLDKLCKAEDGMETLETVILIAIAVIMAGFIINFLTNGQFGDSDQGLVGYIFTRVGEAITSMFGDGIGTDSVAIPG